VRRRDPEVTPPRRRVDVRRPLVPGWAASVAALAFAALPLSASEPPLFPIARATVAPKIDAQLEPVWGESELVWIGEDIYSVTFRALHDERTLYLLFEDLTNAWTPGHDEFWITIDDEGGAPPQRWDGGFGPDVCDADYPEESEEGAWGWIYDEGFALDERWRQITQVGACAEQSHVGFTRAAVSIAVPEGPAVAEVAIPIDGSGTQEFHAGDEIGIYVEIFDGTFRAGYWPKEAGFARAPLAGLGCNAAPGETFDAGFPLDWEIADSSGTTWTLSDACEGNQTGGSGSSACVFKDEPIGAATTTLVSPWFSLAKASSASLAYRGVYAESSSDLSSALTLDVTVDGSNWEPEVDWGVDHGLGGGEAVTVDLAAYVGSPRVRLRWRFTAAHGIASLAQIDEVRLTCGPFLFSDGFESRLLTHWSASTP
jgi:hypothetical protein